MSTTFRKARPDDLDALLALYDHVFTAEEAGLTSVGWLRGIYPTQDTIDAALARDDLFVEETADGIVAAAVINQLQADYYAEVSWQVAASADKVMVMHAFAVDPAFRRQGYARAMLAFAERCARKQGCTVLRLDTNVKNLGGLRLYESSGFVRVAVLTHRFEGFTELDMAMFEKPLTLPAFRRATAHDLDAVSAIYDRIHDEEEAGHMTIGWVRGIYPTRATAEAALERGDLYVCEADGAVAGTAILNHLQGDEYTGAPWTLDAADDQVLVMHTLVIDPAAKGRSLGTAFAAFYERHARAQGCTVLRIDTNKRNTAARHLYAKLGYREISIVPCQFNGIDGVDLVLLEKAVTNA